MTARTRLLPILVLLAFAAALYALHRLLAGHTWTEIAAEFSALPPERLAAAVGAMLVGYAALFVLEHRTLATVGTPVTLRRAALAAFLYHAINNAVGMAGTAGNAIRLRVYARFGLGLPQVAQLVFVASVAFWCAFAALAGVVLGALPPPGGLLGASPGALRALGVTLLFALAAAWTWGARRERRFQVRGLAVELPRTARLVPLVAASAVDWMASGAVLWCLLPGASGTTYVHVLGVFLLAQVAGLVSHVPAGLGVFETVVLAAFAPGAHAGSEVIAALLAYRILYDAAPLALATVAFAVGEAARRPGLRRATAFGSRAVASVAPDVFALCTFCAGALLLVSATVPGDPARLESLSRWLPLPLVEASHLLSAGIGAALLLLAAGLRRRVDSAWVASVASLVGGAIFTFAKGFDWEEALVLLVLALMLSLSRGAFRRRSALWSATPSSFSVAVAGGVLALVLALGLLAYREVPYAHSLWTEFAFRGDAPRFLRAFSAALVVVALILARRALRPAPPDIRAPDAAELDRAAAVVAASPAADSNLALVGDKALLWSEDGSAFLAYARGARTLVAAGDPVGPESARAELVWRFRELCDRHGLACAFWEVHPSALHEYVDAGLSIHKVGEQAHVDLATFDLAGGSRKQLRRAVRHGEETGVEFAIVQPPHAPELLRELRAVSDEWLALHHGREKGFSLGFFDERYLQRTPIALARRGGRVEAFANLWCGAEGRELSVDLMRHRADSTAGAMDFLFAKLFAWGRENGWKRFDLGMAPLAGLEGGPLATLWSRIGAAVHRHAESLYPFQGLRAYKAKFDPSWTPRYLACEGGPGVPLVLADIAQIIARRAPAAPEAPRT